MGIPEAVSQDNRGGRASKCELAHSLFNARFRVCIDGEVLLHIQRGSCFSGLERLWIGVGDRIECSISSALLGCCGPLYSRL